MREPDRREFDELFRYEYPAALRTIYVVLRDWQAAEDVVQDAFAQLVIHWRKVSAYENPGGWVRRVALRKALRWRMRRKSEARALGQAEAPAHAPDPDLDLHRALRALTPLQRAVVALYYLEDRPVGEVAHLLGSTEGTVKSHLHRGRKRLAAILQEGEPTDVLG